MPSNLVTGIDIGTSTIKVAVAENQNGRSVLRFVGKYPSGGIRKGAIADMVEASQAIHHALGELKKVSKGALKNMYVNIGTPQVKVQPSRGIVAVSRADTEIYQDDVDRVVRASQAINLQPNRTIIHNIAKEFIVDGVGDIADPVGLSGSRLEVQSIVIDAFTPHIKNLIKAIELSGGEIKGLVFSPLASGRSALGKAQKDLGVALIDIGYGTTGLCVYEESKLVGVAKFPVGSGNISNDIAIGLKIPVTAADALKLQCGYAMAKEIGTKESIELKKFVADGKGTVSRRFISEIIESRLSEIFEFVQNELKLMGRAGQLAGGVVLVGGGAKLPGLTELVRQELKLPTQIGLSGEEWLVEGASNFNEILEDPEFVTTLGLVLWGSDEEGWNAKSGNFSFSGMSVKKIMGYFLP